MIRTLYDAYHVLATTDQADEAGLVRVPTLVTGGGDVGSTRGWGGSCAQIPVRGRIFGPGAILIEAPTQSLIIAGFCRPGRPRHAARIDTHKPSRFTWDQGRGTRGRHRAHNVCHLLPSS